ncbi:MAG: beta-ketoacyl synthase chain length factor [Pasteurella oralis]|uniref:beta-ketoacyl synthase chain length factor n=1 Tax=Pasteurella oralis TaxID=1071947 RepID=UPI00270B035F|nr:beta-ketoacyl synthase chain length factor [Pasteurella oralis]
MGGTSICKFSFNISHWNIVCNKTLSVEDWRQGETHWLRNAEQWENFNPKLAFLPPLKRRRLSDAARLFFEAAWQLTEQDNNLPVVYASLNSELNRSFALWQSLLQEGDVSPTSFSLSVHNALVGQWSEMRQIKNETTAISAQKDNLEIALLEAFLLLNDGQEKVLVVVAECPPDKRYNVQPFVRPPFSYALAMVVEKGQDYCLSLDRQVVTASGLVDNALTWVKNYHLTQTQWQTPSSCGGAWQWQKK